MIARTRPGLLRRLLAGGVVFAALLALLPMSTSQASSSLLHRRIVERTGSCRTGSAHWDLKTKNLAGGRIYIEFEVDSIPRGARWQMFVSHNGRRIAAVTHTARTRRGVQVNRVRHNQVGRDRIRASGVNPATGNSCFGRLRF